MLGSPGLGGAGGGFSYCGDETVRSPLVNRQWREELLSVSPGCLDELTVTKMIKKRWGPKLAF